MCFMDDNTNVNLNKIDKSNLPTLPYIAHEILLSINNPDSNISDISDYISKEPSLTARIIAAANSAFFSGQRPIYAVEDATVRLGLQRVRVMASSILLADSFDLKKCSEFKADIYWQRAIQSSYTASKIAVELDKEYVESAYLGGLLHNIGSLLLVHCFPSEMTQVIKDFNENKDKDLTIDFFERSVLGIDHNTAGEMLLTEWQLPRDTIAIAANYNTPFYQGEYKTLIDIIKFSLKWSDLGFYEIPDLFDSPLKNEFIMDKIRRQCLKETEQVEAFSKLLAN